MRTVLFLCVVVALVAAQTTPSWPPVFSASVMHSHEQNGNVQNNFYRWFYDETQQIERMDSQVMTTEPTTLTQYIYFNVDPAVEYQLIATIDAVGCTYGDINGTHLPEPVFTNYKYMGKTYVNYVLCYHWNYQDQYMTADLWDTADDAQEPVKWIVTNHMPAMSDTMMFSEFDECAAEDPEIFIIPDTVLAMCNPRP
ncbi:hypothetical protein Pelo_8781 [Pelomyxa schiedti]|nr:hypothetical protein Pelo_8781 [Pelomyxa schiedti]